MLMDVQLNSSLARPHDLTCQVCEKHCVDEVRFFCHIHKYHPDYWRVFSGGRPLSDFIETTSPEPPEPSSSSSSPRHRAGAGSPGPAPPPPREKRYSCSVCHKRYCNQTGYVKHMAVHPGLVDDLRHRVGGGGGGDAGRVALYNCAVCAKLFTKEAYLLRHMEMKLDPAHAVGLEQLKKTSAMFRTTPGAYQSRPASVDDAEEDGAPAAGSPGAAEAGARYEALPRPPALRRSTSCVSPLSTSSPSPVSPPPISSFMPYSTAAGLGRDEPRRVPPPSAPFPPDADVLRYPHPISADYHLRRAGLVDVPYTQTTYRGPPPRSPPVDDEDARPDSSPGTDDGRSPPYADRRRHDYFSSPSSPAFSRFHPYVPPPPAPARTPVSSSTADTPSAASPFGGVAAYRSPHYAFYRAAESAPQPPPPPHLPPDTYLRRSSAELDDRGAPVHGFR